MTTNSAASALSGGAPASAPAAAPAAPAAPVDGASAIAAAAAASAPAAAAPAVAAPAASGEWFSPIQNAEVKTWVEAKGFKDPATLAESAYNLEKLIGFDRAGRTLVIPDENSTPEQRAAFNSKLGVPEKADGYKLPVPQGIPPEFAGEASKWFHEAGVSTKAGEQIAGKWNEYQAARMAADQAAFDAKSDVEYKGLQTEWGAAFEQNIELGKRAALQFIPGTAEERAMTLTNLERALGTGQLLKLMSNIGSGLGEHKMQGGESTNGIMTPAQAQQRIAELKSNKEWSAGYLSGDKTKNQELQNLIAMANPPQ